MLMLYNKINTTKVLIQTYVVVVTCVTCVIKDFQPHGDGYHDSSNEVVNREHPPWLS